MADESQSDAITYYRCTNNSNPGAYGWTYIGKEGPFYTKSEVDVKISAINFPVTSVDGKTGAVTIIPTGGSSGQILTKNSNIDRDIRWTTPSYPITSVNGQTGAIVIAPGGTTGQVLTKNSGINYDFIWADPTGGSADIEFLTADDIAEIIGENFIYNGQVV